MMRGCSRIRYGRSAWIVALLLLVAVGLCLVHVDTPGDDDLCASLGPLTLPVVLVALVLFGRFHGTPMTAYQPVPADLSPPPPEA
jgi:hypothetical protein